MDVCGNDIVSLVGPTLAVVTARVHCVPSGCFASHSQIKLKYGETGPLVYRPYPSRLENQTALRSCFKKLSVGPAENQIRSPPLQSRVLNQVSKQVAFKS